MRVCIYTAIYGGYDDLIPQPAQTIATDFIAFTDVSIRPLEPWRIIVRKDRPEPSPRMRAKFFKVLSHRVFKNGRLTIHDSLLSKIRSFWNIYDYVIWMDGTARIKSSTFVQKVISYLDKYEWALFGHPDRDCIYDEAVASRLYPKYDACLLEQQVEQYRSQGYPAHNGLAAGGLIVRQAHNKDLISVNEMWWAENLKWGYQDQLSLPFVAWQSGHAYATIPGYLWENDLIEWLPHRLDWATV